MVIGSTDAPILCVMDSPPSEGMQAWFWKKLAGWGISKNSIRIVTLIDEEPKNKGGRLSAVQKDTALANLEERIAACTPQIVVAFGPDPLYFLTGHRQDIYDARGYLIPQWMRGVVAKRELRQFSTYKRANPKKGIQAGDPRFKMMKIDSPGALPPSYTGFVIPTFRLDTIRMESFSIQPAFAADMQRAKRAHEGRLSIIDEGFTYRIDLSHQHDYEDGAHIAVDIETHGVDNEAIDRFSISDGVTTYSLEWTQVHQAWLQHQMTRAARLVFHNGPFDIPRLRASGCVIDETKCVDTMMESVTLQPDLHKGLGRITTVFLDTYPWKWDTVKDEDPVTYSAKDAFVTALLEQKQTPLLKQTGVWPLFSGEGYQWGPGVMQTMPILTQATADGLKIDRVEAERWAREELEPQLLADQQKWASKFPGMNPHSPHEVKNLLYGSWKLPIVKTKEDGITVDEYALIKTREYIKTEYARQRDESPWKDDPRCEPDLFDLLLKIRETSKLLSTYAMPVVYSESAFVHPQYLPVSKDAENFAGLVGKGNTATGRLASSRPNIQNQPKKARRLYIPDDPDWCFVQFDYSRAELWSMAAMAKDDVMLADLASGDPYIRVAEDVKIERSNAKNVVLAGQYLAGANKISEMILRQQHLYLSPSQCRLVLDGIAARWWKTAGYKQYLVDLCKARGYVINPFGRVRVFYDRRAAAAVDFIPQSIVADILWCVLRDVALLAREYGGRFTTTVHDSILLQIPRANVRECVQAVHDAMARSFDCVAPGFHLPVSVEVGLPGASWADVKEYVYA